MLIELTLDLMFTASNFFGQVFVYKKLSKSPMYHKSKQHRQYTLVLPVAPIDYVSHGHLTASAHNCDNTKNVKRTPPALVVSPWVKIRLNKNSVNSTFSSLRALENCHKCRSGQISWQISTRPLDDAFFESMSENM